MRMSCLPHTRYVDSTGTERQVLMRQLDTSQFRAFMAEHFGFGEAAEHDIDNVHIAFDPERVGTVCLRDVLNGLAHVSTVSLEQRASFYFSVWDLDGSGDLDKNEVRACVACHRRGYAHVGAGVTLPVSWCRHLLWSGDAYAPQRFRKDQLACRHRAEDAG